MKTVWFRSEHYKDPKKKQDYEAAILNSRVLIDRLLEIIEQKLEAIENTETDFSIYDGGTVFKLAFLNGRKKELKEIADLFDFINKN